MNSLDGAFAADAAVDAAGVYPRAEVTGVILAGGRAERMGGTDKGLLPLAGRPLAAHLVAALRPQVSELLINANRNQSAYAALHNRVVSDGFGVFCGPLAGLLAALEIAATPYLVSVPCDSPLIPPNYVAILYAALQRERAELSVAWDGVRLQPVFLLLRRELAGSLRAFLEPGGRKIDTWFAGHRLAHADFSAQPQMFRNVNTPEELAVLEAELGVCRTSGCFG